MHDFNTKPFVSRLASLRRDDEFLQRSTTDLIRIVSDIESVLMEATALMRLGIDTIDWDDLALMTLNQKKIAWVARQVGEIIGLNLLPPVFIEKYLTEVLNPSLSVDAIFWQRYFNKGLKDAAKVHESPNASIWLIDYYLYALSLDIERNWYDGRTFY
ncbi:hypothetical protein ECA0591 [Pectobacterium atrosepticum SCRI1043]|uniref:Uncharacterized protein n=3 Tax=Pectobacterium atrosepticum TaxID=29471 RepID=Q6D9M3_PECAS|nr:hypothetical protein [Pectobacterium atrosepticum]CAG73507.1 hypothetical protein ECA0591 [Pectobacterium atrosepticum SCRI1043]GKV85754.1 hypothetical protein PEC301296_20660 [Pectobacterium carotovorum subsp. carotovorum]AFH56882.1 hypothetical protein KCQ_13180 [Pectobacterium atrosepticum]AIA69921.1 hypothetical protein EV46_04810 [Pectobacterium atrosepticum]AIK12838.1 hypothetical protein GZ59_09750 [Pectobacterium atrosepticum]